MACLAQIGFVYPEERGDAIGTMYIVAGRAFYSCSSSISTKCVLVTKYGGIGHELCISSSSGAILK